MPIFKEIDEGRAERCNASREIADIHLYMVLYNIQCQRYMLFIDFFIKKDHGKSGLYCQLKTLMCDG
jgi:hypothetical protein